MSDVKKTVTIIKAYVNYFASIFGWLADCLTSFPDFPEELASSKNTKSKVSRTERVDQGELEELEAVD